jgi:hypothetical protein
VPQPTVPPHTPLKEEVASFILRSINSTLNKEELTEQWKESILLSIYKKDDKTA